MKRIYKIVSCEGGLVNNIPASLIIDRLQRLTQSTRLAIFAWLDMTHVENQTFIPLEIREFYRLPHVVAENEYEQNNIPAMGGYLSLVMGRSMALIEITNDEIIPSRVTEAYNQTLDIIRNLTKNDKEVAN